jgi:hypothetical protein
MTASLSTDLDQARAYFGRTRSRVLEVTKGLSEAQWKFKPAPDRWSIAENLEHMVTVQERVLGPVREQLAQAPPPPAGTDTRKIDAIVLEKIPDRSLKAKAPAFLDPRGEWSLGATLERLNRNYEGLVDFIESTPDLRRHVLESPPLKVVTNGEFTSMDAYQWALTVAAHDERHVRQIEEVKADPHYPSATSEAVA